jgi:predicted DNA-binding transcriptional regulator AlpA
MATQMAAGALARPLLVTLEQFAALLGKSSYTLRTDLTRGRLPRPVEGGGAQGKRFRWRLSEVEAWVEAGMPDQATWGAMRHAQQKPKR